VREEQTCKGAPKRKENRNSSSFRPLAPHYECIYGRNDVAGSAGLIEYGVNVCCACWSYCATGVGSASVSAHLRAH
jgi:hypothetical protein